MKTLLTILMAGTLLFLAACDDGPAENAGENIDNAINKASDSIGDAVDNTGDALEEAGDEIQDATN